MFPGCGIAVGKQTAQRRIVGGDDAGFGTFPWQAYIRIGSSRLNNPFTKIWRNLFFVTRNLRHFLFYYVDAFILFYYIFINIYVFDNNIELFILLVYFEKKGIRYTNLMLVNIKCWPKVTTHHRGPCAFLPQSEYKKPYYL